MHFKCVIHPLFLLRLFFQTRKNEKQTEVRYNFQLLLDKRSSLEPESFFCTQARNTIQSHFAKCFCAENDLPTFAILKVSKCDSYNPKKRTKKVCFLFETMCKESRRRCAFLLILSKKTCILFDLKCPKNRAFFSI